jgi:hypothetical protein
MPTRILHGHLLSSLTRTSGAAMGSDNLSMESVSQKCRRVQMQSPTLLPVTASRSTGSSPRSLPWHHSMNDLPSDSTSPLIRWHHVQDAARGSRDFSDDIGARSYLEGTLHLCRHAVMLLVPHCVPKGNQHLSGPCSAVLNEYASLACAFPCLRPLVAECQSVVPHPASTRGTNDRLALGPYRTSRPACLRVRPQASCAGERTYGTSALQAFRTLP